MRKNLKAFYKKEIVPSLVKEFGYKNIEEVPKVLKVSINRGIGEDSRGSKELAVSLKELATISGQQPVVNEARKSVAGFKIRDGMTVGAFTFKSEDDDDAGEEYTASGAEIQYNIASGLKATISLTDYDYKAPSSADATLRTTNDSGTATQLTIGATF